MSTETETFAYFDYYIPSILAGTYTIVAKQTVRPDEQLRSFDARQQFIVRGPQVSLEPKAVQSVFPPSGSRGQYAFCLPHVVLNQRTLPWERPLHPGNKEAPWMALLLFSEDELVGGAGSSTRSTEMNIRNALGEGERESKDDEPKILTPNIALEPDIDPKTAVRVIEVTPAVFHQVTPRLDELAFLAHCRQVETTRKAFNRHNQNGWYAVAVGNRFPEEPAAGDDARKNYVHLVSLEGFGDYLASPYTPTVPESLEGYDLVRLISLAAWSFEVTAAGPEQDFKSLLEGLLAPAEHDPKQLMLQRASEALPDDTPEARHLKERLQNGYVPLPYHLRTGEDTFAWYRGPLTPVVPERLPETLRPFHSASAAMIFDKTHGVFDQSYAVAWQMGRSLALADQAFAVDLLAFARTGRQKIDVLRDRYDSGLVPREIEKITTDDAIVGRFLDDVMSREQADKIAEVKERLGKEEAQTDNADYHPDPTPLKTFMEMDEVQAYLERELKPDLQPLAHWLARLRLLYPVPVHHLLPDPRLLEPESLRFFYVDENWMNALVDGALSLGIHSRRDTFFFAIMLALVEEETRRELARVREQLLGEHDLNGVLSAGQRLSGYFIRSALISGWPGLEIQTYDADGEPLPTLRMDRLADDILFCLLAGIPAQMVFREPEEGWYFGTDAQGKIQLRKLEAGPDNGALIPNTFIEVREVRTPDGGPYIRSKTEGALTSRVVNLAGLTEEIEAQWKGAASGSAAFSLQMIRTPIQLTLEVPDGR